MQKFYFVRHGESIYNVAKGSIVTGRSDHIPLTSNGVLQSQALGDACVTSQIWFSCWHTSPAVRARETGKHIVAKLGYALHPQSDPLLVEKSQGEGEGKRRARVYTPEVRAQRDIAKKDFFPPDGESLRQVEERMFRWLELTSRDYGTETHTILVTTHGHAIRCLVSKILGWDYEQIRACDVPNCSVTKVVHVDGRFAVEAIAEELI